MLDVSENCSAADGLTLVSETICNYHMLIHTCAPSLKYGLDLMLNLCAHGMSNFLCE